MLVAVGGDDLFFSPESVEGLARRLPAAALRLYAGKRHDILNERQFCEDVAAFVAGRPLRPPGP